MIDLSNRPSMDDLLKPIPDEPVVEAAPARPRGAIAVIWVTCLIIIGGAAYAANLQHQQLVALKATGVVTTAEVVATGSTGIGLRHFYEHIRYYSGGATVENDVTITPDQYRATAVGDGARVTYLPAKPSIFHVERVTEADVAADPAALIFKICTCLMAAVFFGAVLDLLRR